MTMCNFWAQNGPFAQMRFFQKTYQWALSFSFMPIYMPKIKLRYSSISEILTIKEYWNLIGREPFLAITWEPDFLINHKNFHFTQIPDKTNDMVFLKSPKIMFWEHFWPFLIIFAQWGFFPKNLAVTHNYIWAPNTMLSLKNKWWANI